MRPDMKKVVMEPARSRSSSRNHKTRKKIQWQGDEDQDFGPAGKTSKRKGQDEDRFDYYERKGSAYSYQVLRRFFQSRVGQSWDKVWSEFCAQVDADSATGVFVRKQARWIVTMNVTMVDGRPCTFSTYLGWCEIDGLYVHPITGVLAENRRHWPWWRERMDPKTKAVVRNMRAHGFDLREFSDLSRVVLLDDVTVAVMSERKEWFIRKYERLSPHDVVATHEIRRKDGTTFQYETTRGSSGAPLRRLKEERPAGLRELKQLESLT